MIPASGVRTGLLGLAHDTFRRQRQLFVKAIQAGAGAITNHYNAACAFTISGDLDQEFERLQASIDAALDGSSSLKADSDFTALHGDPRWNPLVERLAARAKPQRSLPGSARGGFPA